MSKRYHAGRAAETGLVAAYLAEAGFSGPSQVFEAEWGGFLPTYAPGDGQPEALVRGLGTDFKLLRSGVKPYASCRGAHSTLDVILDIRAREGLTADDVARVHLRCSRADMQMLGEREPRTRLAAQMSLPYSVAVACVTGRASLAEYEDGWRADPWVRAFMPRVEMEVDPGLADGTEPYVTIEARNGRRFTGHVPFARGAPENPLGRAEVVAKYAELAARALPPDGVRAVQEAVFSLPEPGSVERLLAALGRPR
jgi:2-methylcitrate dehydratase PrpD